MATISDGTALECLWSPCGVKSSLEYKKVGRAAFRNQCAYFTKRK